MTNELKSTLKNLNLTDLEIKIYELLSIRGPTPAGEIAKRTLSHRRNIYDALERLITKGYLGYIKQNNIRLYQIQNPENLLKQIEEKKQAIENIIPKIQENMKNWQDKKETIFFRGESGIKQIFLEMAQSKEEILVHATSKNIENISKYLFSKYETIRKENKTKTKMIFDESTSKETKIKLKKLKNCKIKYLENFNSTEVSQHIYENNVVTIFWLDEDLSAILVRGSEFANFHKQKFELLWNQK